MTETLMRCPVCDLQIAVDTNYWNMTCTMCGAKLYIHYMESVDDEGGAHWVYLSTSEYGIEGRL